MSFETILQPRARPCPECAGSGKGRRLSDEVILPCACCSGKRLVNASALRRRANHLLAIGDGGYMAGDHDLPFALELRERAKILTQQAADLMAEKPRGNRMSPTRDKVITIITTHLGVDREKIADDKSLTDDLGADSLDTVELTMSMEVEFDIEILDDDMEKIVTVGDAVALVDKLVAEKRG